MAPTMRSSLPGSGRFASGVYSYLSPRLPRKSAGHRSSNSNDRSPVRGSTGETLKGEYARKAAVRATVVDENRPPNVSNGAVRSARNSGGGTTATAANLCHALKEADASIHQPSRASVRGGRSSLARSPSRSARSIPVAVLVESLNSSSNAANESSSEIPEVQVLCINDAVPKRHSFSRPRRSFPHPRVEIPSEVDRDDGAAENSERKGGCIITGKHVSSCASTTSLCSTNYNSNNTATSPSNFATSPTGSSSSSCVATSPTTTSSSMATHINSLYNISAAATNSCTSLPQAASNVMPSRRSLGSSLPHGAAAAAMDAARIAAATATEVVLGARTGRYSRVSIGGTTTAQAQVLSMQPIKLRSLGEARAAEKERLTAEDRAWRFTFVTNQRLRELEAMMTLL
eukprot:TRINITY_DN6552_c0_g1_i1.p1 TRINITY_DN6552_c0_g1~~TRINITY_DN6552_c0_g1_i1.p1  ORF type:complete len:402 (+),score=44.43 TRINITY_DN6552_c0_g1_i1:97-1302(+)